MTRRRTAAVAALVVVVVCAWTCGGRESPDDNGFHQDVANGTNGVEVTFEATVLNDPIESGGHERFEGKAATGERLGSDHNSTLAPSVPHHTGDAGIVPGELYIDPGPRIRVRPT